MDTTLATVNLLTDTRREHLENAYQRMRTGMIPLFSSWRNSSHAEMLDASYREMLQLAASFPVDLARRMLETLIRTRTFFDVLGDNLHKLHGPGFTGYQQEGVGVGVASALRPDDFTATSHRDFSLHLFRGFSIDDAWLNHYLKKDGPTKGWHSNMHFFNQHANDFGFQVSEMAMTTALLNGAVMSENMKREREGGSPEDRAVGLAIFGDGASSNGLTHEAVNFAKVRHIPILEVILNNRISFGTIGAKQHGDIDLVNRGIGYEMPGLSVDGNDVFMVSLAAHWLVSFIRRTSHPAVLECLTIRGHGHNEFDRNPYPQKLFGREEVRRWKTEIRFDPVKLTKETMLDLRLISGDELEALERRITEEVETAEERAFNAEDPPPDRAGLEEVFSDPGCRVSKDLAAAHPGAAGSRIITMREAYREALDEELARNPDLRYMGEDVEDPLGGAWGLTVG
ncbi:hypothetical protein JW905_13725, partial [bacterium]|nr:hypothetical protein [candidate division CSSED10-310 bacterium]